MATSTPWGPSQFTKKYIPGIVQYSTASHGGVHVSKGKVEELPEWAKGLGMKSATGGLWFEEDCACVIPYLAFNLAPVMAAEEWREGKATAEDLEKRFNKTLADHYPTAWEKKHGRKLLPGESWENDERLFKEANKENWIVICASSRPNDMVECTALKGGRQFDSYGRQIGQDGKVFLIPASEYKTRSPYGFVVNLEAHQEITPKN